MTRPCPLCLRAVSLVARACLSPQPAGLGRSKEMMQLLADRPACRLFGCAISLLFSTLFSPLSSLLSPPCRTKEMMQPCLIDPRAISLVVLSPLLFSTLFSPLSSSLSSLPHQRDDATLPDRPACHLFSGARGEGPRGHQRYDATLPDRPACHLFSGARGEGPRGHQRYDATLANATCVPSLFSGARSESAPHRRDDATPV